MTNKCSKCGLASDTGLKRCRRCGTAISETENITSNAGFLKSELVKRIFVFLFASAFTLSGFYISLVLSAKPLRYDQKKAVDRSIEILEERGFTREAFLLRNLTVFRRDDNWLNASIEKENAYAATNFPFEITTLYSDFFVVPVDDVERAAILLHESEHLQGKGEKDAYEFVWKNRDRLGWTMQKYGDSVLWQNVRKQTKEYSPFLFVCELNEFEDCTEPYVY